MTTVGRILVFVIMGFAFLFLGISTVVFTTATDWKKATEVQKTKVSELTKKNSDATAQIEAVKKDLAKAKADHDAAKKALDDKVAALTGDITRMQGEITAARAEVVVAQQNSRTALEEAEARRNETDKLREQKLAVEAQANEFKLHVAELNDQIRLLTRERDVAKKNNDDLRDRVAAYSNALSQNGLPTEVSHYRGLAAPPPVHGQVSRVDAQNKRIELTIGSDDGLVPGHELFLYRTRPQPEYLGKVRIISVDPDQAVATVIGTTIQGKKIKEGDIVSTSFRNGPRS
jgi:hypothetical protein